MKRSILILLIVITTLAVFKPDPVQAQSSPSCSFQPDGSIVCTVGGGDGGGNNNNNENGNGNGNNSNPDGGACTPGEHLGYLVISYDAEASMCEALSVLIDNCTGQVLEPAADEADEISCSPQAPPPQHPCTIFSVNSGGITCNNTEWNVRARVTFPVIYLDVRPYPATLVRWPTAIRNGGQPESSGSGGVDYISHGGSQGNPREGDWKDLRLILTLRPAGPMFVTLPKIGDLMLPDQGAAGSPNMIQWEVPSHPAAGGGPLAGSISGLDELPDDIPVFVGKGHAPYKLFWELRYYEYQAIKECVDGPNGNGNYNCGGGTGHKEVVGYEWKRHSQGGEIPPSAVQNIPASVKADLNGDGTADAYWDNNLTLRRMNNNDRVDDPQYQRSWNWGGIIYWAVREGQGQIGWPGEGG